MATATAEPVTELIRERIAGLKTSGRTYKDIAREAGLAPSMVSQLMLETSQATIYNATKLARPLGFKDLPTLVNAAYARARGAKLETEPAPHRADAIAFALEHGITMGQIDRAMHRYPGEEFESQDAMWWLSRFHEERSLDRQIRGLEGALESIERSEAKQAKKKAVGEWRSRRKKKKQPEPSPATAPSRRIANSGSR